MTPATKTSGSTVREMPPPKAPKVGATDAVAQVRSFVTKVYCTLCTRAVEAVAEFSGNGFGKKRMVAQPRQRCPHCGASLDAAFVLDNLRQVA
jgi:hypothetical protein